MFLRKKFKISFFPKKNFFSNRNTIIFPAVWTRRREITILIFLSFPFWCCTRTSASSPRATPWLGRGLYGRNLHFKNFLKDSFISQFGRIVPTYPSSEAGAWLLWETMATTWGFWGGDLNFGIKMMYGVVTADLTIKITDSMW